MTGQEVALRAELEGYERYGREERAAQVRAELDRLAAPLPVPPAVSVTDDPALAADDLAADVDVKPKAKRRSRS